MIEQPNVDHQPPDASTVFTRDAAGPWRSDDPGISGAGTRDEYTPGRGVAAFTTGALSAAALQPLIAMLLGVERKSPLNLRKLMAIAGLSGLGATGLDYLRETIRKNVDRRREDKTAMFGVTHGAGSLARAVMQRLGSTSHGIPGGAVHGTGIPLDVSNRLIGSGSAPIQNKEAADEMSDIMRPIAYHDKLASSARLVDAWWWVKLAAGPTPPDLSGQPNLIMTPPPPFPPGPPNTPTPPSDEPSLLRRGLLAGGRGIAAGARGLYDLGAGIASLTNDALRGAGSLARSALQRSGPLVHVGLRRAGRGLAAGARGLYGLGSGIAGLTRDALRGSGPLARAALQRTGSGLANTLGGILGGAGKTISTVGGLTRDALRGAGPLARAALQRTGSGLANTLGGLLGGAGKAISTVGGLTGDVARGSWRALSWPFRYLDSHIQIGRAKELADQTHQRSLEKAREAARARLERMRLSAQTPLNPKDVIKFMRQQGFSHKQILNYLTRLRIGQPMPPGPTPPGPTPPGPTPPGPTPPGPTPPLLNAPELHKPLAGGFFNNPWRQGVDAARREVLNSLNDWYRSGAIDADTYRRAAGVRAPGFWNAILDRLRLNPFTSRAAAGQNKMLDRLRSGALERVQGGHTMNALNPLISDGKAPGERDIPSEDEPFNIKQMMPLLMLQQLQGGGQGGFNNMLNMMMLPMQMKMMERMMKGPNKRGPRQ